MFFFIIETSEAIHCLLFGRRSGMSFKQILIETCILESKKTFNVVLNISIYSSSGILKKSKLSFFEISVNSNIFSRVVEVMIGI